MTGEPTPEPSAPTPVEPTPSPTPEPVPSPTPDVTTSTTTTAPDGSAVMVLHPQQFTSLGVGLVLVVLLLSALLVSQLRRPLA